MKMDEIAEIYAEEEDYLRIVFKNFIEFMAKYIQEKDPNVKMNINAPEWNEIIEAYLKTIVD